MSHPRGSEWKLHLEGELVITVVVLPLGFWGTSLW